MKHIALLVALGCAGCVASVGPYPKTAATSAPRLGSSLIFPGGGSSSGGGGSVTQGTTPWQVAYFPAAAASVTSVAGSASVVTLLAANLGRRASYFFNDSTAVLFLKFGSAASVTSYTVQVQPGGYYEAPSSPPYQGIITGIWSAAAGAVRITEMT
jgi:hypothetical protein